MAKDAIGILRRDDKTGGGVDEVVEEWIQAIAGHSR